MCKEIEAERGRDFSAPRHSPRPVDLDLLLLGDLELRTDRLTLPHAEVTSRRFVLAPLLELDPELALPDGTVLREALDATRRGRARRVGGKAAGLMTRTRVLRPAPGVLAFYDGRIEGYSFADGRELGGRGRALARDRQLRDRRRGRRRSSTTPTSRSSTRASSARPSRPRASSELTVVLSHWHLDHIAGTAAFPGAEVIASERTAEHLVQKQAAIEAGTLEGPPAIDPLVLPTRTYSGRRAAAGRATGRSS